MAALATEYIVVIVLGSVLLLLLLIFLLLVCVLVRRRRMLCFRRKEGDQKPFVLPDKKLAERYGKPSHRKAGGRGGEKVKGKGGGKAKGKLKPGLSPHLRKPRGDPFAHNYLENPLVDDDEMDMDWSNPVFDVEKSRSRDAAITIQSWFRMIRVRIPYMQLREATILCQALYRGRVARKLLPQWKREKQARDQLKKKQAGWRKKGTLAALKFYEVKGYGFAEVEQLYGVETMRGAADQLKKLYGGKGKMRLKLFISVKGIKLFDYHTMAHFATVKVSSVSFCTLDPKNKKIFAFINRKKRRNFCHVFQCNEHDAQKMVETMAEAFEVTFKQLEQRREQRVIKREERASRSAQLARVKKDAFHRQSQELDMEVASMIEMAETASLNTPLSGRKQTVAEVHRDREDSGEDSSYSGSLSGSREALLPKRRSQARESGLLVSHSATPTKEKPAEESFDPSQMDTYFTDIKKGMEDMSQELESDSRRATMESKYRHRKKNDTIL